MQTHFDALIIGSGQAGPFLAVRLAAAGLKVALVEAAVSWSPPTWLSLKVTDAEVVPS